MKRWMMIWLLVAFGSVAQAQEKKREFTPAEQQAMLEQLERGEQVDFAAVGEKRTASAPDKKRRYCSTMTELYDRYGTQEGFSSVIYGKRMMEMMADRVRGEDKELAKLLEGIRSIRIISTQRPHADFELDTRWWIDHTFVEDQQLSHVVEEGQTTDTYLVDGGRYNQSTFVLVSFGAREQVVLHIMGYFSVKDISRLSSIRPR